MGRMRERVSICFVQIAYGVLGGNGASTRRSYHLMIFGCDIICSFPVVTRNELDQLERLDHCERAVFLLTNQQEYLGILKEFVLESRHPKRLSR